MKCKLLLTLFCFILSKSIFSQELPFINGNYFSFGIAFPITKFLDKGHSPNLYKGKGGLALNFAISNVSKNILSKFSIDFVLSELSNKNKQLIYSSNSDFTNIHLAYQYGFNILQKNSTNLFFGPKINLEFYGNNYFNLKSNNSFSYNNRIYLDANINGTFRLNDNANYFIRTDHSVSLVNFDTRSKWNTLLPFDGIVPNYSPKTILKNGRFVTFNKFLNFNHFIDISFRDNTTNNLFSLFHNYQYSYNFNSPHPLYIDKQLIGLNAHLIYR